MPDRHRLLRRAVHARLGALREGRLTLAEPGGTLHFGPGGPPAARITVHDPRFYRALALGGSVGGAEAYAAGWWTTDDLPGVVRVMVRNRDVLERLDGGWARLAVPARAVAHALRRNTRRGSRRNIAAHYDLGNEFFALFLDETLTYSCGVFERPEATLRDASIAKYDRLCRKLALNPSDHVVEIGTGWGGFAVHAAGEYGCRVTTTTISPAQFAYATRRVADAGLADRVTVVRRDYRDLRGRFDKLVSIEMIEAVGHRYYDAFFRQCGALLAPDGVMALQAITILDRLYDRARRHVDFIKRYIFPGSCLPSLAALGAAMARASDLRLVHLEDITPHYAETLKRWRENFVAAWDKVGALGFPESFRRIWEFYLAYCEGGYREGVLGDVQLLLAKPRYRIQPAD